MHTTSKLLLAGASLFLALPVLAADSEGTGGLVRHFPGGYVQKTKTVEIKGILRRVDVLGNAWPVANPRENIIRCCPLIDRSYWEIRAAGKTYRLDFGARKDLAALAEKLNGKTVLVVGRPEGRMDLESVRDKDGVAIMSRPSYFDALVVSRLEAVETEAIRETVEIEVLGTLDHVGPLTAEEVNIWAIPSRARQWQGYVVRAQGQEYLLQLGGNARLTEVASKLRGQRVVVTGRLESWSDGGGCIPRIYPMIVVTDLKATRAEIPFCGTRMP